jgi:hypothetical protein
MGELELRGDCPDCGTCIGVWTTCPECGWYDEGAWEDALVSELPPDMRALAGRFQ